MAKSGGVMKWIGGGCLLLVVLCAGGGTAAYFGVTSILRASPPYSESVARVRASKAAQELLGNPIEAGWMISGSVNTTGSGGTANLSIPVHGPKGKGSIAVEATKNTDRWIYRTMRLHVDGSDSEVDLLSPGDVKIENL